ncbi:MAG TPA: hypothetical protein VHY21_03195 [Pseudonocardiaceae bacterium]|nr:hypothetical protein [Pseudonocardiaceae bacterium]
MITTDSTTAPAISTTEAGNVVDLLRTAIRTGSPVGELYRGDAHLDATVPNWWFAHPGRFSELHRTPTADGEVVEYTLRWTEDGTPHAAHHVHVLTVDRARDRIATDRVWCGGRWDAALLDQMGQTDG